MMFVTLTYADRHVPVQGVEPEHVRNFLKRFRKLCELPIRYYLVGEYGDLRGRPHYHLLIFGSNNQQAVKWSWTVPLKPFEKGPLEPYGNCHFAQVAPETIFYGTSHLVKLGSAKSKWESGRNREFSRMSRRPGIGALGLDRIGEFVNSEFGSDYIAREGDVPGSIRFSGQFFALGRYLRQRIRESAGMEPGTPKETLAEARAIKEAEYRALGAPYFESKRKRDAQKARGLSILHREKKRQ